MKPSFNKYNQRINTEKPKKQAKKQIKHSNTVQNPITSNNQIISGYFVNEKPYKELVIARVNTFLYGVLGVLVAFCLVCYYFVSCKEVQLNQISRATLELNYENDELQNKIDSLQSYYNIDRAVSRTNILERAKQVVEVNATGIPKVNLKKSTVQKNQNSALVVSY